MGLVNQVVPRDGIDAFVDDYARTIAGNAPLTVAACKTVVAELLKDPEDRDTGLCDRVVDACFASEDYKEGRAAFLEKRAPRVHREVSRRIAAASGPGSVGGTAPYPAGRRGGRLRAGRRRRRPDWTDA